MTLYTRFRFSIVVIVVAILIVNLVLSGLAAAGRPQGRAMMISAAALDGVAIILISLLIWAYSYIGGDISYHEEGVYYGYEVQKDE